MTSTQTPAALIPVSCSCRICGRNAATLGQSLPLRAEVPPMLLAAAKGKAHGLVHLAHDPNPVTGAATRARCGVRPA